MSATYELPKLPYSLDALEPVISAQIMDLHYNKHHKAYTDNLNKLAAEYEAAEKAKDASKMISLQSGIKFNGGGYINHSIFWTNLAPKGKGGGGTPQGALADAIKRDFGSFDTFKEMMTTKTVAVQGSGWGWLGYNKGIKRLEIATCQNQDPLTITGLLPLLGIDVWEHAYYLQYKNVRPDYVKAIWDIINWSNVAERFAKAST